MRAHAATKMSRGVGLKVALIKCPDWPCERGCEIRGFYREMGYTVICMRGRRLSVQLGTGFKGRRLGPQ